MQKTLLSALVLGFGFCVSTVTSASADSALEKARASGQMNIALYNQAPWGFRSPDGTLSGQSVDVIVTAMRAIGVKEFTPIVSDFSALIPGLLAHRFDVVGAAMFVTPERCKLVSFGEPDIKSVDAVIVKAGNPAKIATYSDVAKNPDMKIGVARGSMQAKNAVAAGIPTDRVLLFEDNQSALSAMIAGRVDALTSSVGSVIAMLPSATEAGFERVLPFKGVVDANGNEKVGYAALAFRPEDKDLRDAYNAELAKMKKDGRLVAILKKYGFSEADMATDATTEALCAGGK